jgi:hypothetical protein
LQKKLYARQAEVFAASAAYTDYEIGRVIQAIEDMGKLDNTLVIYICGDNGTSAEGTLSGTFNQMTEAAKYQVFPLDNSAFTRLVTPRPSATAGRTVFTYSGENAGIPVANAPSILDKDYRRGYPHTGGRQLQRAVPLRRAAGLKLLCIIRTFLELAQYVRQLLLEFSGEKTPALVAICH